MRSFPVPFSPNRSTLASVLPNFSAVENILQMASDSPIIWGRGVFPFASTATCSSSVSTSFLLLLNFIPDESVASSFSFSQGFVMKSVAPDLMALTAFSVSEYAVMRITTASLSVLRIFSSHSNPSWPLMASLRKFMSRRMMSGRYSFMKKSIFSGVLATRIFSAYGSRSRLRAKRTSSLSSTTSTFPKFSIFPFGFLCAKIMYCCG